MNENYLWDKTGEPDPEVKELEDILSVLKYQERPLVLPEDLQVPQRRHHYSWLAIAATVALALVAAGLWFSLRSTKRPQPSSAQNQQIAPSSGAEPDAIKTPETALTDDRPSAKQSSGKKKHNYNVANQALIARREREREEALAAKEQLLIALRLASEKLNQAQRRTQLPAIPNQNRNQHKVG